MAGGWTDRICDPVRPRADAAGVQLRSIAVASMIDSFMKFAGKRKWRASSEPCNGGPRYRVENLQSL
jgi:hypothetical protein